MEKGSFNTQTDAATYDSDPKYLNFDQVVIDGSYDGTDVDIGPILDLGLVTNPTGTPPVLGPLLGGLTGGDSAPAGITPAGISSGETTILVTFTDASTMSIDLTFAAFQALAATQGLSSVNPGTVDLNALVDITPNVGKTIDSITTSNISDWNNATSDMNFSLSFFQIKLGGTAFAGAFGIQSGGGQGLGPGLGVVVPPASHLGIGYDFVSTAAASPNKLTLQIQPQITNAQLGADGLVSVSFVLDDLSVVGPYDIGADEIFTLATAMSQLNQPGLTFTSTDLEWDLSALAGHTITAIHWDVNPVFTASPYPLGNTSNITMSVNYSVPTHITIGNLTVFSLGNGAPWIAGGWLAASPTIQITAAWLATVVIGVDVPVDSAAIVAAIAAQKPTLLSSQDIAYTDLVAIATASVTNPYNGGKIMGVTQTITADYGDSVLAPDATAAIEFRYDAPWGSQVLYTVEPILGTLTVTPGPGVSPFPQTINNDTIIMRIALRPLTIPAIPAVIYATQPYELRQRNLPAFKLVITGTPSDEDVHEFVAYCLCSQGPIAGKWEWTPLQCSILDDNAGVIGINHIVVDAAHGNITDYPSGYGNGIMIIPQKEYTGPWNYIRFVFLPTTIPSVLTGFGLQVIANAREVI
jgi:hypothetical protein